MMIRFWELKHFLFRQTALHALLIFLCCFTRTNLGFSPHSSRWRLACTEVLHKRIRAREMSIFLSVQEDGNMIRVAWWRDSNSAGRKGREVFLKRDELWHKIRSDSAVPLDGGERRGRMSFHHWGPRREMSQGRGTKGQHFRAVIFSFWESCHDAVISCKAKPFGGAFFFCFNTAAFNWKHHNYLLRLFLTLKTSCPPASENPYSDSSSTAAAGKLTDTKSIDAFIL